VNRFVQPIRRPLSTEGIFGEKEGSLPNLRRLCFHSTCFQHSDLVFNFELRMIFLNQA
jgi:hypothetical protein